MLNMMPYAIDGEAQRRLRSTGMGAPRWHGLATKAVPDAHNVPHSDADTNARIMRM